MKFETFEKAPITEAILDIRTELSSDVNFEDLEKYHTEIINDFSKKQVSVQFQAEFKVEKDESPMSNVQSVNNGFIFKDDVNSKVIQFRLDGFTFNKIKPYESWEAFSKEANKHWEKYCEIAKPRKINRIALRFINKINIPENESSLKEYIKLLPTVPKSFPKKQLELFLRNVFFDEKLNIKSIVTETIDINEKTEILTPFILDIDVFKESTTGFDSGKIWAEFEELRICKNKLFFDITTKKCQDLFK